LMLIFDDILRKGFEADIFINGLAEHLRNLLVCKDAATLPLLEVSDKLKDRYQQQANLAPTSFVLSALSIANDCDINFKMARNKRLHTEMALIKMAYIARAANPTGAMPISAAPLEKKTVDLNNDTAMTPAVDAAPAPVTPSVQAIEPTVSPVAQTPVPPVEPQAVPPIVTPIPEAQVYVEPETPPTNVVNEPEQIKPLASTPSLGKSTGFSMNLDAIEASVKEETVAQAAEEEEKEPLTFEVLKAAWDKYIAQAGSANLQNIMRSTELILISDTEIELKVSSQLAENTIRQDLELMEYLRKELKRPILNRKLSIDKSKIIAAPERKKPMTDRERLLRMNELNPLVQTILEKFDMKFDEK